MPANNLALAATDGRPTKSFSIFSEFVGFFALLALFALIYPATAEAHTVGISRGNYQLQKTDVTAELVFARQELIAALPHLDTNGDGFLSALEIAGARNAIEATIVDDLHVIASSGPCVGNLQDAFLTEQDGFVVRAVYRCPEEPENLSFHLKFLAALSHGHRHLATAERNTFQAVAYASNAEFKIAANINKSANSRVVRTVMWPLFRLGIQHILTGYDHLIFLLGLILVGNRLRPLFFIVTAFTLAHSITLCMAALGILTLSPNFVEPAIALSITYIGVENWFVKDPRSRWLITFPFGLLHGFGFAGALQEIALPLGQIPLALAAFNVGVEAGQIAFLIVVLPAVLWLRQHRWFTDRGVKGMSTGIALAGIGWLIIRVA